MAEEKDGLTQIEEKLRRKIDTEFKESVEMFTKSLTVADAQFSCKVRDWFKAAFDPTKGALAAYDYDPCMAILRILVLNEIGACRTYYAKDHCGSGTGDMLVKKSQWWSEEIRGKKTQRTIDALLDGSREAEPDTHVTIVGKGITVSSVETGEITHEHRQRLEEGGISKEEVDGSA